jgi:hypothetical protein
MFTNWLDTEFLPLCSNLQASDGVSLLARKSVPVHLLGWSWVEPLLASAERKQKRSRAERYPPGATEVWTVMSAAALRWQIERRWLFVSCRDQEITERKTSSECCYSVVLATERVAGFRSKATWHKLAFFALVRPADDLLPIRAL